LSLRAVVKRALDVLISAALLILLSPIMLLVGALVWLDLGWPVLFAQRRPGLHCRPFTIYKFRTMGEDPVHDEPIPDELRVTRLSGFLRASSIDEIPELINVLRGDMSLVGPRPLLVRYLDRYTPEQRRRHDVRPGITGLAQVRGRNLLSWEERFQIDVWYVDNWSLWLDGQIIALTILKVVKREGINAADHLTMYEFGGQSGETTGHPKHLQ